MLVVARITDPIRPIDRLSIETLWNSPDGGVLVSWERGRIKARETPDLADSALRGELPVLAWKGGIDRPLKAGRKFGSLFYYATWLGLRGEDLCIDTEQTYTHTCSRYGVEVTFTGRREDLDTA